MFRKVFKFRIFISLSWGYSKVKMKALSKESPITLIELPPTQFGVLNGDPAYDIYSLFRLPSRAIPVLEAVLRAKGWKNVVSINPFYDGENGKLTSENWERILNSEALLLSAITRTAPQSMELGKKYKLANPKGIVIAGGPDPTFRFEEWLSHVDIVVMGEGENTLSELMKRLGKNPGSLENIKGIAFKKNGKIIVTEDRELISPEELGKLPYPHYGKNTREKVTTAIIETSRGCPRACKYCSVSRFYGRRYRVKPVEYVLKGIRQVKDMGGGGIFFADDNLAGNPEHAIELLEAITKAGLNSKSGTAQVTVEVIKNEKLLKALKNAGFKILCVGIEGLVDSTLKDLGKPYKAEQNKAAVAELRKRGFWVHGMLMPGGDGDTPEDLKQLKEWANRNLDSVQYFPIVPLPGTKFYEAMKEEGRILTHAWHLYDGHHVIVRPKHFTPARLQETIYEMYRSFYSPWESLKRLVKSPFWKWKLTIGASVYANLLGGLKKVLYSPQSIAHLEFLRERS